MSNVLIGIIGVILFIGLALAGATFLGARFQQSRNTSVASATVHAVSQVGNAINLSNAENSTTVKAGDPPSTLTTGYIRTVPGNPTGGDAPFITTNAAATSGGAGRLVLMKLSGAALDVCQAIARQTTNGLDDVGQDGIVDAAQADDLPQGPAGCFHTTAAFGALQNDAYYAFSRP